MKKLLLFFNHVIQLQISDSYLVEGAQHQEKHDTIQIHPCFDHHGYSGEKNNNGNFILILFYLLLYRKTHTKETHIDDLYVRPYTEDTLRILCNKSIAVTLDVIFMCHWKLFLCDLEEQVKISAPSQIVFPQSSIRKMLPSCSSC